MSRSPTTRALSTKALFSSLNVLFLHHVNPDFQVRRIEELPKLDAESDMRIQHLCPYIETLAAKAFRFKVDPEKLKFFKVRSLICS